MNRRAFFSTLPVAAVGAAVPVQAEQESGFMSIWTHPPNVTRKTQVLLDGLPVRGVVAVDEAKGLMLLRYRRRNERALSIRSYQGSGVTVSVGRQLVQSEKHFRCCWDCGELFRSIAHKAPDGVYVVRDLTCAECIRKAKAGLLR
jgi:hypothetical protein